MARKKGRGFVDELILAIDQPPATAESSTDAPDHTPDHNTPAPDGNRSVVRRVGVPKSVDPRRCRMWPLADRFVTQITEQSCRSLIEDIRATGQSQRALARPLTNDPHYDYELIYGARRRFSCEFLGIDLQILVDRSLTDAEAFSMMRSENLGREDITIYEEARSHARALSAGIYANQSRMAAALEKSRSQISKMLTIAKTPTEVVELIGGPSHLTQRSGIALGHAWDQLDSDEQDLILSDLRSMQETESPRAIRESLFRRLSIAADHDIAQRRKVRSLTYSAADPYQCKVSLVGALSKPDTRGVVRARHTVQIEGADKDLCTRTLDKIQALLAQIDELQEGSGESKKSTEN